MRAFSRGENVGNLAFRNPTADLRRQEGLPAFQGAGQHVQHASRDMGHPGHDEDVAMTDARRAGHAVFDKVGTRGHASHPQSRVSKAAARFIIALQHGAGLRVNFDIDVKSPCDGIDGDVIVRRADSPCREEIVVADAKRVHSLHDGIAIIGDHPDFPQPDPLHIQP